ncbi:MAG: anion permease [Clostridia bacterium]|nr:anion permease [Clostridia bacterium]
MKIVSFVKREIVLCIAFVAALVSVFFVPPDVGYTEYIDTHVLILLFCLMAVVAGVQKCGLLEKFAHVLCKGEKSLKTIITILVLLCFFTSMLITNDVALITFVPFAVLVLDLIGMNKYLIFTVVMQTIAANLGSMATPVGNPQNLYLYSKFGMSILDFCGNVLPISLVSLFLIIICTICIKNEKVNVAFEKTAEIEQGKKLILWLGLFALCLLCVFHIVNDYILLGTVLVALVVCEREIFKKVDYSLLITFVFFFIFAGNIARIDIIREFIAGQMANNAKATTLIMSQVISNVPAAVMLSNFTNNGEILLTHTNIGGLGTIIASLASLISFKIYAKCENANILKYFTVFTLFNVLFLFVLCMIF